MAGESCQNDPMFYLNFAYSVKENGEPEYPQVHWMLLELPRALRQVGVQGDSIVDIGSGPTVHNAASLAAHFQNVYLAEYQEGARDFLEKWLRKENVGFDWTPFFKIIGENTESDGESVEGRLRERVRAVWSCDIKAPRAGLPPDSPAGFDAVFSAGVLAVSTKDKDEYKNALDNVVALIKPGGYFIYNDLIQPSVEEMESKFKDCGHAEDGQHHHGGVEPGVESDYGGHGISLKEEEFREHVEALGLRILHFDKKEMDGEWFEGFAEFLLVASKS